MPPSRKPRGNGRRIKHDVGAARADGKARDLDAPGAILNPGGGGGPGRGRDARLRRTGHRDRLRRLGKGGFLEVDRNEERRHAARADLEGIMKHPQQDNDRLWSTFEQVEW